MLSDLLIVVSQSLVEQVILMLTNLGLLLGNSLVAFALSVQQNGSLNVSPVVVTDGGPGILVQTDLSRMGLFSGAHDGLSALGSPSPGAALLGGTLLTVTLDNSGLLSGHGHQQIPCSVHVLAVTGNEGGEVVGVLVEDAVAPHGQSLIVQDAGVVLHEAQGQVAANNTGQLSAAFSGSNQLLHFVSGGRGQNLRSQQTFLDQLTNILQSLTVLILTVGRVQLTGLIHVEVNVAVPVNEHIDQPAHGLTRQSAGSTGQRNLIGQTVAVGILGLESDQNIVQLIGVGGHLQAQLVQPCLVDPNLVVHDIDHGVLQFGECIDSAGTVSSLHTTPVVLLRVLVGQSETLPPNSGSLFVVEVGSQVYEHTVTAVTLVQVSTQIEAQQDIGQGTITSDHGRQLSLVVLCAGGEELELQLVAGLLFQPLGVVVVVVVTNHGALGDTNGQSDRAITALVAGLLSFTATSGKQRHHAYDTQQQCNNSLHVFPPKNINYILTPAE